MNSIVNEQQKKGVRKLSLREDIEQNAINKILEFIHNIFWGEDSSQYNTVVDSWLISFFWLQFFRFIFLLVNTVLIITYVYIYSRQVFPYISSFMALLTFFANKWLFTAVGK